MVDHDGVAVTAADTGDGDHARRRGGIAVPADAAEVDSAVELVALDDRIGAHAERRAIDAVTGRWSFARCRRLPGLPTSHLALDRLRGPRQFVELALVVGLLRFDLGEQLGLVGLLARPTPRRADACWTRSDESSSASVLGLVLRASACRR